MPFMLNIIKNVTFGDNKFKLVNGYQPEVYKSSCIRIADFRWLVIKPKPA